MKSIRRFSVLLTLWSVLVYLRGDQIGHAGCEWVKLLLLFWKPLLFTMAAAIICQLLSSSSCVWDHLPHLTNRKLPDQIAADPVSEVTLGVHSLSRLSRAAVLATHDTVPFGTLPRQWQRPSTFHRWHPTSRLISVNCIPIVFAHGHAYLACTEHTIWWLFGMHSRPPLTITTDSFSCCLSSQYYHCYRGSARLRVLYTWPVR